MRATESICAGVGFGSGTETIHVNIAILGRHNYAARITSINVTLSQCKSTKPVVSVYKKLKQILRTHCT